MATATEPDLKPQKAYDKLASMFRLLMTAAELESFSSRQLEMTKKLWIWRG